MVVLQNRGFSKAEVDNLGKKVNKLFRFNPNGLIFIPFHTSILHILLFDRNILLLKQ